MNMEQYEDSIQAFNNAIRIKPDYHEAWLEKGQANNLLGRYQETLAACNEAVELKPNYYWAWLCKGTALGMLGKSKKTIEALNQAIDIVILPRYCTLRVKPL